jgi:hypothetical protein
MKTSFFIGFFLLVSEFAFSQNGNVDYNYAHGNGTVLSQTTENGNFIVIRKHEQRFSIYPSGMRPYNKSYITAYEEPNKNSQKLFVLKDGDYVNTLQLASIKYFSTNRSSNWVKIKNDDNRIGWLDMDDEWDRYSDGIWRILEMLNVNNRNWTIRKLNGDLIIYEVLNVRDKPGVNGTNVLFKLMGDYRNAVSVTILAITEEPDTIDGITDYWIKIEDENNRIGWVFGGYTTVERGGPKYRTPENQIRFNFNLP